MSSKTKINTILAKSTSKYTQNKAVIIPSNCHIINHVELQICCYFFISIVQFLQSY